MIKKNDNNDDKKLNFENCFQCHLRCVCPYAQRLFSGLFFYYAYTRAGAHTHTHTHTQFVFFPRGLVGMLAHTHTHTHTHTQRERGRERERDVHTHVHTHTCTHTHETWRQRTSASSESKTDNIASFRRSQSSTFFLKAYTRKAYT